MVRNFASKSEVRATALEEAVKVTSTHPHFHGTLNNPAVIQYASDEILTLATKFENYIWEGKVE